MKTRLKVLVTLLLISGCLLSSCAIMPRKSYRSGVVLRMGSNKTAIELASAPVQVTQVTHFPALDAQHFDAQELPPEVSTQDSQTAAYTEEGKASWYHRKFAWRKTASSEPYLPKEFTAAHRTLPFGTVVEVTNLQNNRRCTVRINDRGPRIKGRIIDLSEAAADELGFIRQGLAPVRIQVIEKPETQ